MSSSDRIISFPTRRRLLEGMGVVGAMAAIFPAWADGVADLDLPGGPSRRALTTAFPQKGSMILQRTRPPLLETPFEVFDRSVFTPNDQFFVRWHWAVIPNAVDVATFKLAVHGHVNQPCSLSLAELLAMPRVELAAVNQCSGNSRGLFQPRVPGGQWRNGAMGNARWTGVRLRDVLDRAGIKAGAVAVRFNGLDEPVVDGAPDFMKSLDIDHARDGEVMLAYEMNGEQLPLLNGFPLRLVVPGWFSTYWLKMLNDIEVLDAPDENYWMKTSYRIPDTPHASVKPGESGFKTVPINRMGPRSFFTNLADAATVKPGAAVPVRGIAFGGDAGVAQVELSVDGGRSWRKTTLGRDEGIYGFRHWSTEVAAPASGTLALAVRCTNSKGEAELERRRLRAKRDRAPRAQSRVIPQRREGAPMALSIRAVGCGALIAAALVLAATEGEAAPAPTVAAGGGVTLRSVEIDLPDSDRLFPGGDEADAINNNCLACHSVGMVLNQPSLSRADWQAEVEKMRKIYLAPVAAEDAPAIVDYLAKLGSGR